MIGKVIFGPKKANTWVNIQVESPRSYKNTLSLMESMRKWRPMP